jgi:Mrp family chromosome partitioning ATPase
VNTLLGLRDEAPPAAEKPRVTPIRGDVQRKAAIPSPSAPAGPIHTQQTVTQQVLSQQIHTQQIHALVQQLFFRRDSQPARHVGFVTVEASTDTATLCLQAARALAEEDRYDIGLVDANPDSPPLQSQLDVSVPSRAEATWTIGPRLWMVPRHSWLPDACASRATAANLSRLRELIAEFDFSILWCAPVSWLTASIGQTCDGLVLVLTADKTRRVVAAQIKDQLSKAQVPLLGTVLVDRRFPVPQGLYRNL